MTQLTDLSFDPAEPEAIAAFAGRIVLFASGSGPLEVLGRRVNRLMRGALDRVLASDAFARLEPGEAVDLAWPAGLAAEALVLVKLPRKSTVPLARKAGATIARAKGSAALLVLAGGLPLAAEVAYGLVMRVYDFSDHKTAEKKPQGAVSVMVADPAADRKSTRLNSSHG